MSTEHTIPERSDDEFSRVFGEMLDFIQDQVNDPHVEYVYDCARAAAQYVDEHRDEAGELVTSLVNLVDERWDYLNKNIEVSAPVWVIDPETGYFMVCAQLVNEEVTSRGFIISRKGLGSTPEELEQYKFEAAHYVHLSPAEQWPKGAHGVIFLDDITYLALPHPSEAMRAKNLQYSRPDIVVAIDTIAGHAGRPDQILKDLKHLTLRLDADAAQDQELMKDVAAYLNMNVMLEKNVNYRMEVQGDIVRIADDGDLIGDAYEQPQRLVTRVKNIAILPAPSRLGMDDKGPRVHHLYLHLDALNGSLQEDDSMLIPCESINWISSSRYDHDLPPTYVEEGNNG